MGGSGCPWGCRTRASTSSECRLRARARPGTMSREARPDDRWRPAAGVMFGYLSKDTPCVLGEVPAQYLDALLEGKDLTGRERERSRGHRKARSPAPDLRLPTGRGTVSVGESAPGSGDIPEPAQSSPRGVHRGGHRRCATARGRGRWCADGDLGARDVLSRTRCRCQRLDSSGGRHARGSRATVHHHGHARCRRLARHSSRRCDLRPRRQ